MTTGVRLNDSLKPLVVLSNAGIHEVEVKCMKLGVLLMQSSSSVSRIALSLELSAHTATQHNATLPTVGPIDITFVFPTSGKHAPPQSNHCMH